MKKILALLLALFLPLTAIAGSVDSAYHSVSQSRLVYSSTNVTTSAWVQLTSSVPVDVNYMEIFDSSGQSLQFGIGASGSEAVKFNIIPGGNGPIKFYVPAGSRIALKAITATASAGYINVNYYQ